MIPSLQKITRKAILSHSTTITVATRKFTSKNSSYYKKVSLRNNQVIQGIYKCLLCFNGFLMLTHTLLLMSENLLWLPIKKILFIFAQVLHHQGHHNTIL